jgi:hypothetical protein
VTVEPRRGSEFLFLHVSWGDGRQSLNVARMPADGNPPLRFVKEKDGEAPAEGFMRYLNDLGNEGWALQTYQPAASAAQQEGAGAWARSASTGFSPPSGVYLLERALREAAPAPPAAGLEPPALQTAAPPPAPQSAEAAIAPSQRGRAAPAAVLAAARWQALRNTAHNETLSRLKSLLAAASAQLSDAGSPEDVLPYQQ